MKTPHAWILCFIFLASPVALADCGSGCNLGINGYFYRQSSCPESPCAKYETKCQCTDKNWRFNDCISKCDYCYAFGNIGAR